MTSQKDKSLDTELSLSRRSSRYLSAIERREGFLRKQLDKGIESEQQRQYTERELAALQWAMAYIKRSLAYEPELTEMIEWAQENARTLSEAGFHICA